MFVEHPGGAVINLSFLFVDVRGSTTLAERMTPASFAGLMNRFYGDATAVLVKSGAFIDKFVGDEVMAVYMPAFCGENHALAAITAARELLEATTREGASETPLPIGVGVNTGLCYFGTVQGVEGTFADMTALGDAVNVAARLGSASAAGEALISESACSAAGLSLAGCERRHLDLKGKSQSTDVRVVHADSALSIGQPESVVTGKSSPSSP
jgi:adenylate cyclase